MVLLVGGDSFPVRRYREPDTRYERLKTDPVRYKHDMVHTLLQNFMVKYSQISYFLSKITLPQRFEAWKYFTWCWGSYQINWLWTLQGINLSYWRNPYILWNNWIYVSIEINYGFVNSCKVRVCRIWLYEITYRLAGTGWWRWNGLLRLNWDLDTGCDATVDGARTPIFLSFWYPEPAGLGHDLKLILIRVSSQECDLGKHTVPARRFVCRVQKSIQPSSRQKYP